MSWFLLVVQILPMVVKLVGLAEEAFASYQSSGAVKKQVVLSGLEAITTGMQFVSTGGQAATWGQISQIAPSLIDGVVALANGASALAGGTDVVLDDGFPSHQADQ